MTTNNIHKILYEKFGFTTFREGQEETINTALSHEHCLVMLPTGTGKSLCYQLVGYAMEKLTIIVSPLLSLMQDQVTRMKKLGERRVTSLTSLQTSYERRHILKNIHNYRFLFLSPEMLHQKTVLNILKKQAIGLFVVDEAHCISQWGMDFRPDYLNLGKIRQVLGQPLTMALTATATPQVQQEIKDVLFSKNEKVTDIIYSVDRKNIAFHVEQMRGNKREILLNFAQNLPKPGVIYFSSKRETDAVRDYLKENTVFEVASYHADLNSEDRVKTQEKFIHDDIDIICATSAFGMGIDKGNVRFVIHYHLPSSPEDYLQEIGRAGRDGKQSIAILLYEPGDERIPLFFIDSSLPNKNQLEYAFSNNRVLFEDDPALNLAHYFKEANYEIDEALEIVKNRYKYKRHQVKVMLNYISSTLCYRSHLVHYFNESLLVRPSLCCSQCENTLLNYFLSEENNKITRDIQTKNWRQIIDELF